MKIGKNSDDIVKDAPLRAHFAQNRLSLYPLRQLLGSVDSRVRPDVATKGETSYKAVQKKMDWSVSV